MKPNNLKEILEQNNNVIDDTIGLIKLDTFRKTLADSKFIVIAGLEGIGKTTFLGNLAMSQARQNEKILFLSVDDYSYNFQILNEFNNIDEKQLTDSFDMLYNLHVNEERINNLTDLLTIIDSSVNNVGVKTIYIDDIHLMDNNRFEDTEGLLNIIYTELFNKDIQVILTSRVSRDVAERPGRGDPQKDDLLYSILPYISDKILFLNRLSFRNFPEDEDGNDTNSVMNIIEYLHDQTITHTLRMNNRFDYY